MVTWRTLVVAVCTTRSATLGHSATLLTLDPRTHVLEIRLRMLRIRYFVLHARRWLVVAALVAVRHHSLLGHDRVSYVAGLVKVW